MVAILPTHQRAEISQAVRAMYTTVARQPDLGFHFPVGRAAAELLGYPDELLDSVPRDALAAFAGVACPFEQNSINTGQTVLDVGAGSGTDAFIARELVGSAGRVIALDVTHAMLQRLKLTAEKARSENVETLLADAEAVPLPAEAVDAVISNGALNLVLDKKSAFAEIFRVLRPGCPLQLADVVLGQPVTEACRADPRLWVECVVGATLEDALLELLETIGFRDVRVLRRIDYFAASPSSDTREIATALEAQALVLHACKPTKEVVPAAETPAAGDSLPQADQLLEAYGQTCTSLEPLIKRQMRTMQSGQVLEVRADDATARIGIPAWCRLSGNPLLSMVREEDGRTRFFLRRK